MKVVITNAGERSKIVADVLIKDVSQWLPVSNVEILTSEECKKIIEKFGMGTLDYVALSKWVSFELKSDIDPWLEDSQMRILTNLFEGIGLEFWIPKTGFACLIA